MMFQQPTTKCGANSRQMERNPISLTGLHIKYMEIFLYSFTQEFTTTKGVEDMIRLRNVNKVYANGFHAVKNINLEIQKGDIFGIIGLSGAGKSSLIRMLNRLEESSSGEIWIEGSNINLLSKEDLLERRKKIGIIFQHFNLLSSKTVSENVAFALEIAKWKKGEIQARVQELLELVELTDKANDYPSQLSGGQKQRVAIARALANHPDILLSDEATSALDPKTTKSILDLLRTIQKKFSLTIVMITHQMEVVREICNKVAIMSEGEIVERGAVHHIFSKPKMDITKELISYVPQHEEETSFDQRKGHHLLRLQFLGSISEEPILSRIIRECNIDLSILSGNIDTLSTMKVGHLYIELSGDMSAQEKAMHSLQEAGVEIEVIYNGL